MTSTHALQDSSTMLRRNLRRMRRYPSTTLFQVLLPVVFLLLFGYAFGATLGNGLPTMAAGRAGYVNYVAPAIILLTVAGGATSAAISVATDMDEGIIDRFRTMAIWRPSVLAGHVMAAMIQNLVAVAVVIAAAVGVGFRPQAGALGWLTAAGVLAMITLAMTWLGVASGLAAKGLETASNAPLLLMLLPFLGSGFVPTASMPTGLRQFATYQPFTPFTDATRGLLNGTAVGDHVMVSAVWCASIATVGYVWSVKRYSRGPRVPPGQ